MRVLIRLTAPVCFAAWLRSCLPADAAVARLRRYGGWVWGNVGCEAVATHFYSRDNFKLNRTAALTEWGQLLNVYIQAGLAI